jgi:hypothetical protein
MSTRSGGGPKKGPRHQNRTAFKHNPHSTKSAKIDALPNEGLCARCSEIIEWRKKYHKFKPLTGPRTCQECHQRTVVHAYHVLCVLCARARNCCAKCREQRTIIKPVVLPEEAKRDQDRLEDEFAKMRLSERRTFLRKLQKGEPAAAAATTTATPPEDDEDEEREEGEDDASEPEDDDDDEEEEEEEDAEEK